MTDVDGNPRLVDDRDSPDAGNSDGIMPIVDVGASEFQPGGFRVDDEGDGKVTICHFPPGNPGTALTVSVSVNDVDAHLAHDNECGTYQ